MLKVRELFGIYGNSSSMNAVKINLLKYINSLVSLQKRTYSKLHLFIWMTY